MPTVKIERTGQLLTVPTIRELARYLTKCKRKIDDDMIRDGDTVPSMDITLAVGEDGFGLQTGDNSYTGSAYHYSYWGVNTLYRRSNSRELAKLLIDDAVDQAV